MLQLTSKITIAITARTDEVRNEWIEKFARLLGNFTRQDNIGGWVGEKVVETEPSVALTAWLDTEDAWSTAAKVLDLAKEYQAAAQQEAVYVEYLTPTKAGALIIFEDDWAEACTTLLEVYDPFAAVLNSFCGAQGVETTESGAPVVETVINF